jgi:hypothetical protein
MNQIFLLKLIADFIKDDKPSVEQIRCARTIVENLIKFQDKPQPVNPNNDLDDEAYNAKRELEGEV